LGITQSLFATLEAYRSSDKGRSIEEFFRGSGRTTAVAGKRVTCLVQECVSHKGFVSMNTL